MLTFWKGQSDDFNNAKILVLGLIGPIFLVGNILLLANWLSEKGVIDWAKNIRTEYLTGTEFTIIAVLLILLVSPKAKASGLIRRCPVCDKVLVTRESYCMVFNGFIVFAVFTSTVISVA